VPSTVLSPTFSIERHKLKNGLRVVMAPDRSAPAVAVAVHYDVGFRSEPEGRTGFAHLFEHIMFEGSEHLPKLEHAKLIQSNGGEFNGSTTPDFTNYFEVVPTGALELALFLEADRMRSPVITEETVANQIDVVKEEIRLNVMNRPYGGMHWIYLPPIAFSTFNNSHNGYGSFVDLDAATPDDAKEFFDKYYAPGNAVLTLVGDFDPDATIKLVEQHFNGVKKRSVPSRADFSEPLAGEERRGQHHDPMSPTPAIVVGYRTPDPHADLDAYAAYYLLVQALTDGDASRLHQRLVKTGLVSFIGGVLGPFDGWLEMRDPLLFNLLAIYPPGGASVDDILGAVDEEVDRLVGDFHDNELQRVRTAVAAAYLRKIDSVVARALTLAPLEQQRGRAELLNELPEALARVTAADVRASAARWLTPASRAVLDWQPGGGS